MSESKHILVIGAGIGGLTTAALLLQAGLRVTVLEGHIYPGGSAGTFYNHGYRFDAGATLVGGFSPGGPHARLAQRLGITWPIRSADPAWVTHLPGKSVTQWASRERWEEERRRAFPGSEPFWKAQERLAGAAWDISSRSFPWPPSGARDLLTLGSALRPRTLLAAPHLFSTVVSLAPHGAPDDFMTFLDLQLLISAQTTARNAGALYGSAALDLPRRGVNYVHGGMGGLAQTLVNWIRANGGEVLYRQPVKKILMRGERASGVETTKGLELACDAVVANLTPWGLESLLQENPPQSLRQEVSRRPPTWGAFTLYLGLDGKLLPPGAPSHHQVIADPSRPVGEGNTIFLSLSDPSDSTRAPRGMRAATLSTHTQAAQWWQAAREDPAAYGAMKAEWTERALQTASLALPWLRPAVRLCLPGTPLTFAFYTRRPQGMVGGFPQTSIFNARGPRTGIKNVWLVGDSIFPGQSTAGTTLGGWRVADEVIRAYSGFAREGH